MTHLSNKTLLAAVTCAWLLTAAVLVAVHPTVANVTREGQVAPSSNPSSDPVGSIR